MRAAKWSLAALLLTAVLSIPSFSATPDRIAGAIDSSHGAALQKSLHPKAQAKYDEGAVEPSFRLDSIVIFFSPSPAQQKALDQLVAQQQDPSSPNYHKWLTPAQYAGRFGLSQNDLSKITAWLESEGFTVQQVGAGHNHVIVTGTAASVQSAFKTEIHRYNVEGEEHFANSTPIMIPAAIEGVVSGIIGVNNFRPHSASRLRMGSRLPHPNYYGGSSTDTELVNYLAPADVNTIYDVPSNLNGTGQSLAIIGETDVFLNDINDFRGPFGLPTISCSGTNSTTSLITSCSDPHFKYVLYLPSGATDPGKPDSVQEGDIGEADLDLEWSGAVAPDAQIIFVNAPDPSGNGVYDSLTYAIDNTVAHVISMSYGNCEAESVSLESLLEQAVSQGITIMNSAGDSGAAGCDGNPPGNNPTPPYEGAANGLAVNYPASSVYVVAAGGTGISLADDSFPSPATTYWGTSNGTTGTEGYGGTAKGYIPETAWNDDVAFAELCTSGDIGDPSQNSFCYPPSGGGAGVLITSAQTAQEDYWVSQGGGGGSNCFTQNTTTGECISGFSQPSWQSGLTVQGAPTGVRWVPDISLLASPNLPGYIYCTPENPDAATPDYTSTCASGIATAVSNFSIVGGTSASSPIFAAIVALLNQSLNTPSGSGLGDIHKTLYTIAAEANHGNGAFQPVTNGNNQVYCQPGTPANQPSAIQCPAGASDGPIGYLASNADTNTGYNLVTGLGSVDVAKFVSAWAASQASFALSASAINPTTVAAGNSVTATITVAPSSGSNFSGTVSFSCANQTGISCSFSPTTVTGGSGPTTVTISVAANVAAGATSVTVTGTSGSVSANTTVGFTVTASSQTFTITSNIASGTISVKQGQTAQVNLTISSTNGFTTTSGGNTTTVLPLTYTCTSSPAISLSNCTFAPPSPSQSTAVTVSVSTKAPTNAQALPFDHGTRIFYAALFPGLFGIMFIAGSRRRSLRGIRMLGLIFVLGASMLWLGSCGGSNNSSTGSPGTPTGSYTVTINATTGGSGPIANSYQFTLTVTQ